MEIPPMNKKLLAIGIGVLVIILLMLIFVMPMISTKSINSYFEKSTVKPGETTKLIVTITNTMSENAPNVMVTAKATDGTSVIITGSPQSIPIIGKGETRRVEFQVSSVGSALDGSYLIQINTNVNQFQPNDIYLVVKK